MFGLIFGSNDGEFYKFIIGDIGMELNIKSVESSNLNLDNLLKGISVGVNSPECTHGWSPKKEVKK
jgi:hypothetical protein